MTVFEEDLNDMADKLEELGIHNSKIFVTGATGLIGSILVKAILYGNAKYNLKNHVIAFVRDLAKAEKIFENKKDLEYCVGDINFPINYEGKVDFIIHAASATKSLQMMKTPVETIWTSLAGSRNVLEFAREKNIRNMVYLSSMEVFGIVESTVGRVHENQIGYIDLQDIRSSYPESKRMVENMCVCYASEYHVPVVSARLAQTFGAGVSKDETRVFAEFARSAIDGKDIVLHTLGNSCGNYVYTADAVAAIFILLVKGQPGEVYTVANEENTMTIKEMAQMVAEKMAGGTIDIVIALQEDNAYGYAAETKLKLDATKLREIGWQPKFNLEEAYSRLIMDWKNQE